MCTLPGSPETCWHQVPVAHRWLVPAFTPHLLSCIHLSLVPLSCPLDWIINIYYLFLGVGEGRIQLIAVPTPNMLPPGCLIWCSAREGWHGDRLYLKKNGNLLFISFMFLIEVVLHHFPPSLSSLQPLPNALPPTPPIPSQSQVDNLFFFDYDCCTSTHIHMCAKI